MSELQKGGKADMLELGVWPFCKKLIGPYELNSPRYPTNKKLAAGMHDTLQISFKSDGGRSLLVHTEPCMLDRSLKAEV